MRQWNRQPFPVSSTALHDRRRKSEVKKNRAGEDFSSPASLQLQLRHEPDLPPFGLPFQNCCPAVNVLRAPAHRKGNQSVRRYQPAKGLLLVRPKTGTNQSPCAGRAKSWRLGTGKHAPTNHAHDFSPFRRQSRPFRSARTTSPRRIPPRSAPAEARSLKLPVCLERERELPEASRRHSPAAAPISRRQRVPTVCLCKQPHGCRPPVEPSSSHRVPHSRTKTQRTAFSRGPNARFAL